MIAKKRSSTWKSLVPLAALGLVTLASACSVTASPAPPPEEAIVPQGTLTVDWTIDGTKDPDECFQGDAASIAVDITTIDGAPVGSFQQSCDAFATSIALDPGDYGATATLLDATGAARTTSVPINPFTIHPAAELVTPIDFSADSFF